MSKPQNQVSEEEWLWGWDSTEGIVSVFANAMGDASVFRRLKAPNTLVREEARFRPWVLLTSLRHLSHLGPRLRRKEYTLSEGPEVTYEELCGPGELRYLVSAEDGRTLAGAILRGASNRQKPPLRHLKELGPENVLILPPEEQYLVMSGRTYFRGLTFDDLARAQFDLETTGLNPEIDRIFLVAFRDTLGKTQLLEVEGDKHPDEAEASLLRRFVEALQAADPDVIENHNLHGFDLPFLVRRAEKLGVPLWLGRMGPPGLSRRPAARGASLGRELTDSIPSAAPQNTGSPARNVRSRFTVAGREFIDTMDAVLRHDFSARDLPGHGLKAVARHFGIAEEDREKIPGSQVFEVFRTAPERVRRYAASDVSEAAGLARLLGGAAFALAKMVPRRYERLADAGPATGVLDPLLVRAYLRARTALPAHQSGDGTSHSGAALHLFAAGVAKNVVKADVASLYPSLMRHYQIGPKRDSLGVLLALVDRLVEQRLAAKTKAKSLPKGSPSRHAEEAMSAAMKLVVNSAYGYLGAVSLTRFADVHAANEVTRRGRETLSLICRGLKERGVTLLEADTDGVYFSVPSNLTETDERRIVSEVRASLPPLVNLEFEGRYAAMLSHEPKNYALLPYDGPILLRGVAFRSSRAEPFGEAFLRRAIRCLLNGDVAGVREEYIQTVLSLRRRELPTFDVSALVRLTKSRAQYLAMRERRKELPYEAMLQNNRQNWAAFERIRVYRKTGGKAGLVQELEDGSLPTNQAHDPRDYDVEYYVRALRDNFACRLARGLTAEDFHIVVADPSQPSLFGTSLENALPILTQLNDPLLGSPS